MAEITYLPEVECMVSEGFIPNQVTVGVTDEKGNRQYLRIGKKTITEHGGKTYLPVGIVKLDYRTQRALIELPEEADSGANRLWVPFSSFRQEESDPV